MKTLFTSILLGLVLAASRASADLVAETLKRYDDFALHIQLSDTTGPCAPRHRVLVTVVERFSAYAFADGCWRATAGGDVVVSARTFEGQKKFTVTQPIEEFTNKESLRKYARPSSR